MFKIVYPMFERGRIMKKELLLALRDYSFGFARLQYDKLTDGIIAGCGISVTDKRLTVDPGIVKFNKFIYVMTAPQDVFYEPNEQSISVKIRFSTSAAATTDFVNYAGNLVLDDEIALRENELEVCRFKLKRGSRLRNDYTGFDDIETEYDTVNLARTSWAGPERPGIHQVILKCFAKEALRTGLTEAWDIMFCSHCLNGDSMHRSVIEAYISCKLDQEKQELTNSDIYRDLERILRTALSGSGQRRQRGAKRMMIEMD